jgi:hypothetical protein
MRVAIAAEQTGAVSDAAVRAAVADAAVLAAVGAEGINPPKRGRGRPRKEAPTIPAPPPAVDVTVTIPPAAAVPVMALHVEATPSIVTSSITLPAATPALLPVAAPDPNRARIGTLYVACRPTSGVWKEFATLVAKAKVAIGPAVYYAGYGYKANGMLLQMIDQIIQHDRPVAVVVPDPSAQEATICMALLYSLADNVVEALR